MKEGTQSRYESGGFSVNPVKLTASVHGEWGKEQSVINHPVYYHFNFLSVGEVDELHMYGGVIRASFGFGRIRKLVMHHEVDTGQQSGGGFSVTFPISPSAVSSSVLDNIKSVSVSISTGGMVRLNGGKCIFDVPGIEILNWQEFNIPDRQYDDRTTVTATWNNTTLGDAAPTGTTAVGSIGMQVGDIHVHTDVPSGVIPGHAGREQVWHKHTTAELEAKASRAPLTKEELEKLQQSRKSLEDAAERRKAERLDKGGVPSDAPERVALREDMRNIVDYMKQSGYLGQKEEGYKNMALPGEKDYYLPEEGLDHFMPEF